MDKYYDGQRARLKEIRNKLGLSQAQLSAQLPHPLSSIAAIEAGNQKMSVQLVFKLQDRVVSDLNGNVRIITEDAPKREDEYSLRSEWLFRGIGEQFDFGEIGTSSRFLNIDIINEKKNYSLRMDGVVFYLVQDESMKDTFLKGDVVAINTDKKKLVSGRIYLVKIFGEYLLRAIYAVDAVKVNLVPFNKELAPVIETARVDVEIVGTYEYLVRKEG